MNENKIIRGTWSTVRDEKDPTLFRTCAELTAKKIHEAGWGDFPIKIGNKRAMEICILAEAYLEALKELKALKSEGD